MLNPDQIRQEIAEIENRVQKIASEISNKEKQLEKQRKHHSELLIRHLDKKIKPRCIETAHRLAKRLESELEALRQATGQMVGKLDEARSKLALAELYDGPVKEYRKAKSSFFGQAEAIRTSADELNHQILALNEDINTFLDGAGTPLDLLENLPRNPLLTGLSLAAFVKGEIKGGTIHENGAFLQRVASEYKELADSLRKPEDLEEIWTALAYRLHALSGQASSLIPRDMKYSTPAPDQVRRKQHEGSAVIRIPQPRPPRPMTDGEKKARRARQEASFYR